MPGNRIKATIIKININFKKKKINKIKGTGFLFGLPIVVTIA